MFACERLPLNEAVAQVFFFLFFFLYSHSLAFRALSGLSSQARTMAGPGAQLPHRPRREEAGGWILREPLSMLKYGGDR